MPDVSVPKAAVEVSVLHKGISALPAPLCTDAAPQAYAKPRGLTSHQYAPSPGDSADVARRGEGRAHATLSSVPGGMKSPFQQI